MRTYLVVAEWPHQTGPVTTTYTFDSASEHEALLEAKRHGLGGDTPIAIQHFDGDAIVLKKVTPELWSALEATA